MANKTNSIVIKILGSTAKNIILLVNILFAVFHLFGVIATIISPLWTTFFAYFGLFSPFIILLNICFIILWIIKKRKLWIISASILILTYPYVNSVFTVPYRKLTNPTFDKEIKVLSYNISSLSGVKKFDDFVKFIDSTDADIICFQEFGFFRKDKDKLKNVLQNKYPHSHIWYKNQTKNYWWGVATFSKYPIINKKKVDYNSLYNVSIYSDIAINTDTVRVINNHLESNKFTLSDIKQYRTLNEDLSGDNIMNISSLLSRKLSKAYKIRASQAAIVRKVIDNSPYRLVVCGDFNDVTGSYAYRKIKGNLVDLFTATSWGYRYSFHKNYMLVGIDHILIDKSFVPLSSQIDRITFSDHYPLIGSFGMKRSK